MGTVPRPSPSSSHLAHTPSTVTRPSPSLPRRPAVSPISTKMPPLRPLPPLHQRPTLAMRRPALKLTFCRLLLMPSKFSLFNYLFNCFSSYVPHPSHTPYLFIEQ